MTVALFFDPCPTCGRKVTNARVDRGDKFLFNADMTRVLPPAEMTLIPCGHPVYGYTWTAESGVEWKVS